MQTQETTEAPRKIDTMKRGDRALMAATAAAIAGFYANAGLVLLETAGPGPIYDDPLGLVQIATYAAVVVIYSTVAGAAIESLTAPAIERRQQRRQEARRQRAAAAAARTADRERQAAATPAPAPGDTPDDTILPGGRQRPGAAGAERHAYASAYTATDDQSHDMAAGIQHIEIAIGKLEDARDAVKAAARRMGLEPAELNGRFYLYNPTTRQQYSVLFKQISKRQRRGFWRKRK